MANLSLYPILMCFQAVCWELFSLYLSLVFPACHVHPCGQGSGKDISGGPVKNRHCTDLICLIIFILLGSLRWTWHERAELLDTGSRKDSLKEDELWILDCSSF